MHGGKKMELTNEQIKSRPVLLDLNYGASIDPIHCTIAQNLHEKFCSMTAKESIEFILGNYDTNMENQDERNKAAALASRIKAFITSQKDLYTIQILREADNNVPLVCKVDRLNQVLDDERQKLIKNYLEDSSDRANRLVWSVSMYLLEKTTLG
jgi:hypothetical protein